MNCVCTICNDGSDSGNKSTTATLTFFRKELIYDVANYAYVEGDIMQPDEEDSRHQVFDITQQGNVDRATRILNLAHTEVLEMLYPFTKVQVDDGFADNDKLTEPDTYTVLLTLPEGFSFTTVELLKNLIHEYLVCRVLADWFSITKQSAAANWFAKLEDIKDKVKKAIAHRLGRIRRGWSPF